MEFKSLPKIELHCHLDGSVRIETIIDIARKENIQLPTYDTNELKKLVTVTDGCSCLVEYISKFKIPIMVMQSKESLRRIAFELYEDAARENVKYLEVRFAPLLHTEKGLATNEIIESVVQGMRDAETLYDIKGNVILSFMKNMPEESIFPVIEAAAKYIGKGVAAVDLAGGEDEGFSRKFVNAIKKAEELGYRITIHAGETGIGKNVLEAVNLLGAERIGHGIFITNSPEAYKLVKEKEIPLEVCPTSNVQTKAAAGIKEHPFINFLKDGLKVTLNTDNRSVSNTSLTKEFEKINKEFNLLQEDYNRIYLNGVEAAFTDDETKKELKEYLNKK